MESEHAGVRRNILDYLVRHPGAKDTREGVINWWVAKPCPDERLADAVLADLVAQGWIVKRETASQAIYSLNHARVQEIKTFLASDRET